MICFSPMLFFILFQFSLESAIHFFEITILVSFIYRILDIWINGSFLISSGKIPLLKLIKVLKILEQSNPDAFIKIRYTNSIENIKVYKKQNKNTWWLECEVPQKNEKYMKSISALKEINLQRYFFVGESKIEFQDIIILGHEIENISEILITYFIKLYGCKRSSKVYVTFCKTKVEKSILNGYNS